MSQFHFGQNSWQFLENFEWFFSIFFQPEKYDFDTYIGFLWNIWALIVQILQFFFGARFLQYVPVGSQNINFLFLSPQGHYT